MEKNLVTIFNAGHTLVWKNSSVVSEIPKGTVNDIICLNVEYGLECTGDWLYDIRIEGDKKTYMVIHNEIEVQLKETA